MILRRKTRKFRILSIASMIILAYTTGAGALWFILPSLAESLSGNIAYAGFLLAFPALVSLFVDIPLGDLADKIDRRWILVFCLSLMFIAGLLLGSVDTVARLLVLLFFIGIVTPSVYIVTTTYVVESSPKKHAASFLGTFTSSVHLGFSLGALAAGYVIASHPHSYIRYIGLILAGACLTASFASNRLGASPSKSLRKGMSSVLRDDKVFMREISDFRKMGLTGAGIIAVTVLFTVFDGMVWTLEPLLYQRLGLSATQGGIILAAFVLPLILFEAPAGFLADKLGRKKVLSVGLVCAGCFAILFSKATTFNMLFTFAFLTTSGLALSWPATEGILAEHTEKKKTGEIIGVWRASEDVGYILGPIIGGLIASKTSIGQVFGYVGVVFVFAGIIAMVFSFSREPHAL